MTGHNNLWSDSLQRANQEMWAAADHRQRTRALNEWLMNHQPCLFARFAARNNLLHFTFVEERDLAESPKRVIAQIREGHSEAMQRMFAAECAGWIVLLIARSWANLPPPAATDALPKRFLEALIEATGAIADGDGLVLGDVCLPIAGDDNLGLRWISPFNYFDARGDLGWLIDRRIPGGIGYALNSVGHMVAMGAVTPDKAVRWSRASISAARNASLVGNGNTFTCQHQPDHALPSGMLENHPPDEYGPFSLTTQFGRRMTSTSTTGGWSAPTSRADGRGQVVRLAEGPWQHRRPPRRG